MAVSMMILLTIAIVVGIIALGALIISYLRKRKAIGAANGAGRNEQIYVGNLAYRVKEDSLNDFFSQYGRVRDIKIIRNHKTGQSKGFAFITYSSCDEAEKSLNAHGKELYGRSLVVRIAKVREEQGSMV